jgi:hypothetical protein
MYNLMVSVELTIILFRGANGRPSKKQIYKGVRVMDLGPSHERINNRTENGKVLAFTVTFSRR